MGCMKTTVDKIQLVKEEAEERFFFFFFKSNWERKESDVKSSVWSQGIGTIESRVENKGQEIKWEVISGKKIKKRCNLSLTFNWPSWWEARKYHQYLKSYRQEGRINQWGFQLDSSLLGVVAIKEICFFKGS